MCPIGFVWNMVQADKNEKLADERNMKAYNMVSEAEAAVEYINEEMQKTLIKLANRKRGILSTSFSEFIEVYEVLSRIEFEESDGIRELMSANMPVESVQMLKTQVHTAGIEMSNLQLMGTLFVGNPFKGNMGGFSGLIAKDAEINADLARKRKSHAAVVESQSKAIIEALKIIKERADRILQVLTKLNRLFRLSLKEMRGIIDKNGTERRLYTRNDKEKLRVGLNLIGTIKKIIDTPLIDKEGELTKQSLEAIAVGQQYLNQLSEN